MRLFKRLLNRLYRPNHKLSYSQSGEDRIIRFIFDVLQMPLISYLDIGAHHPFYLNNTALFYRTGSRGINIEPDPALFQGFKRWRTRDINLNIGIGTSTGEADFYIISTPTLNTFSSEIAKSINSRGQYHIKDVVKMPIDTVMNVIQRYNKNQFPHFLNLDAEGIDKDILLSMSFKESSPLVICIETLGFSTSGEGIKDIEISRHLEAQGYFIYADTYINTIFVKHDIWVQALKR